MDIFGDIAGFATALFTAWAAWSAWQATSVAKSVAEDSRTIAGEQTKALMSAAKANALASRIAFYNEQIAELTEWLNIVRNSVTSARGQIPAKEAELKELKMQRDHCAWWLDRQSDALGVGLRHECPSSPYNGEVPRWRGEQ